MAEDVREWEQTFQALRHWGTPRDFMRLSSWASPDEIVELLKEIGPPEHAKAMIVAFKNEMDNDKMNRRLLNGGWRSLQLVALIGGAVLGAQTLFAGLAILALWLKSGG